MKVFSFVNKISDIERSNPNLANGVINGLNIEIKRLKTPPIAPKMISIDGIVYSTLVFLLAC